MSTTSNEIERELEKVLDQASHYDEAQLLSGLSVLVLDAKEYFDRHPADGIEGETFRSIYGETITSSGFWGDWQDQKQWELDVLAEFNDVAFLPPGELTRQAAEGNPDVTSLGDPELVHEWFVYPGQDFFKRFGRNFRGTICGEGGPYEQFEDGLVGQEQLPKVIAATLLTSGLSGGTVWVPLAVYVGLLLVKTGLQTYCEAPESELEDLL